MTDTAVIDQGRRRWQSVVYFVSAQRGILLAIAIFALMLSMFAVVLGWMSGR